MKDGITLTPEEWDERIPLFAGVHQTSFCEFESVAKEHFVPVMGKSVFGGSLIAQSMESASKTVPRHMELHEIHGKFLDRANVNDYIHYFVKKLRDGRSYVSRRVDAMQGTTLLFTATMSFQMPEPEQPQFFAPPPKIVMDGDFKLQLNIQEGQNFLPKEVLAPEKCMLSYKRYEHLLSTIPKDDPMYAMCAKWTSDQRHVYPVEYRPAVPTMYDKDGHLQYGTSVAYWVRSRGNSPGSINFQRAMLAFQTDQLLLVNMQSSIRSLVPSMMASLDHTMWFHNDFTMKDWLLMVLENQAISNGRALVATRAYRQDGVLVAIAIQEGVFRYDTNPVSRL